MPLPDTERVTKELDCRFAQQPGDFHKRRIIFWYDEDREFADKVENGEIVLENARLVTLTETNHFALKKFLSYDDTTHNFCVYCPLREEEKTDWLLPVKLYSESFRADLLSFWLEEMGASQSPVVREAVKGYRSFFAAKAHRQKVAALPEKMTRPVQVHKAVMAVLCGLKVTDPDSILRTVLRAGLHGEQNGLYLSLVRYGADRAFWDMAAQVSGYRRESPRLEELAFTLFLTAASRALPEEAWRGLEEWISLPHQSYCHDFMAEWLGSGKTAELYHMLRAAEGELGLPARLSRLNVLELEEAYLFPCVDECILRKFMGDINANAIPVQEILEVTERRRTGPWYGLTRDYYEGLVEVAHMQQFYLDHAEGFHIVEPQNLWKAYTEDYYHMDRYYRRFHLAFSKTLASSRPDLGDPYKLVADVVEALYAHWFLGNLGEAWARAAGDDLAAYGRVLEIPQQDSFYVNHVKAAGTRVFVIISDALRYEVAAALAEELTRNTQSEVQLSSMEAVFPTVTKFGMAALLPHRTLTVERGADGLEVLADGLPTSAAAREKVLKRSAPASTVLKYADLIRLKMEERRALVKGMQVVYLYHNRIDSTGHEDETGTPAACEEAVAELKNLVRMVVNEFGGTRIFITADHGFLYTYEPLPEAAKVERTTAEEDVEVDRRYVITEKGAHPAYLMPVKFLDSRYDAFAPIGNTRIRKKGGGLNFVHGGASLQEMVVPLISYHFMRSDSTGFKSHPEKYKTRPVTLTLLSSNRKITNLIVSLEFYQKEPVGVSREAAAYQLYFTDASGDVVSDTQRIIADRTGTDTQARIFRVTFNLKSRTYDPKEPCTLVIAREDRQAVPERVEFSVNIEFAMDDFDFFS